MNKQRRVLITTTYNEMGIIIDTKAEEVSKDSPELDNTFGDPISRQAAGDTISRCELFNRLANVQTLADAYAVIWLHHLEDNKEEGINIPIWKTDKGMRLTQNYITEENFKEIPDIDVQEVGRLQFRGRFKAGTDEDHEKFVSDNDSRETMETWEACHAEGVRARGVSKELPPAVKELHEQSLTQGRDVLANADEGEKKKWVSKDGTDWSGAFGEDPAK